MAKQTKLNAKQIELLTGKLYQAYYYSKALDWSYVSVRDGRVAEGLCKRVVPLLRKVWNNGYRYCLTPEGEKLRAELLAAAQTEAQGNYADVPSVPHVDVDNGYPTIEKGTRGLCGTITTPATVRGQLNHVLKVEYDDIPHNAYSVDVRDFTPFSAFDSGLLYDQPQPFIVTCAMQKEIDNISFVSLVQEIVRVGYGINQATLIAKHLNTQADLEWLESKHRETFATPAQPSAEGVTFGELEIITSDSGIESRAMWINIEKATTLFVEASAVSKHVKQATADLQAENAALREALEAIANLSDVSPTHDLEDSNGLYGLGIENGREAAREIAREALKKSE